MLPELEQEDVRTHSNYNNAAFLVTGSFPEFGWVRTLSPGEGRFYNERDDARSAARGLPRYAMPPSSFSPSGGAVGENVHLNDFPYTVIGVMEKKKQDSSYDGWDVNKVFHSVCRPCSAISRTSRRPRRRTFDQLLVTPRSVDQHEACKDEIRRALGRMHNFDPNDKEACPIWDTVQEAKAFATMTDGMKYFLGAVGLVTLVLGGLGVMNVMMVAVRERTREIGVRKALGARGARDHEAVLFRGDDDRGAQRSGRNGHRLRAVRARESVADAGVFRRAACRRGVGSAGVRAAGNDCRAVGALSRTAGGVGGSD